MPSDEPAPQEKPPRRRFLRRLALAAGTVGAAGAGVLLPGCGGGGNVGSTASPDSAGTAASSSGAKNQCVLPSELSQEAKSGREQYGYVAQSPHPQKHCNTCQFWEPAEAGATCGGCRLFAGPVHPEGYCNSYLRG